MVARSPIGRAVAGLEPWLQLALFLLHTRRQRGDWHAYLASLPEPQTPLSWPDAEVDLLQGTQLHSTLMSYRCCVCRWPVHCDALSLPPLGRASCDCMRQLCRVTPLQQAPGACVRRSTCRHFFQGLFSKLEGQVFARDRGTFDPEHFSYERLVWAISLVRAHVHKPLEGKDVALVPIADLVRRLLCVPCSSRQALLRLVLHMAVPEELCATDQGRRPAGSHHCCACRCSTSGGWTPSGGCRPTCSRGARR